MRLPPLLAAMRRNKVGVAVIGLQTALTLAILCNGLFIIHGYVEMMRRPSGVDEPNIFTLSNLWVGKPGDMAARLQTDLAALRSLPGVVDAYAGDSYPLSNNGNSEGIKLNPEQQRETTTSAVYFADDHGLGTLGLRLIAGRDFTRADIVDHGSSDTIPKVGVIVTRALAERLFPQGGALGKSIYIESKDYGNPIIGIVERLQSSFVQPSFSQYNDYSILAPLRYVSPYTDYIVRVQPGRLAAVMQAARKGLIDINRARVIGRVRSLSEERAIAYRDERGLAVILGVVCAAMLAVTTFGIVGLTSYWVTQRRRQIGIRRALGATKTAIMRHFQTENLVIAAGGALLGIALAVSLNLWMVAHFEMARLDVAYALAGALAVLLLGQVAVLWPALRAASIAPALATRSV